MMCSAVLARDHSSPEYAISMATTIGKCPLCGGDLVEKCVDKLLQGGVHAATITVRAEVCQKCGEHLYDMETIEQFEEIRDKLERQDVGDFKPVGQTFEVV